MPIFGPLWTDCPDGGSEATGMGAALTKVYSQWAELLRCFKPAGIIIQSSITVCSQKTGK